jgi:hypothetical protein
MESTAFFEKKINLTPSDFNKVKKTPIDDILLEKAKELMEKKCSENGFVLPGFLKLLSRSMGRFEDGNKTGDATYYVKLEGKIVYPADGIRVVGEVIRKNKMGLYVEYKKAIRVQVPRDFHVGSEEYDSVEVGDMIEVELKRSKFQINDPYILASGVFIAKKSSASEGEEQEEQEEEEQGAAQQMAEVEESEDEADGNEEDAESFAEDGESVVEGDEEVEESEEEEEEQ